MMLPGLYGLLMARLFEGGWIGRRLPKNVTTPFEEEEWDFGSKEEGPFAFYVAFFFLLLTRNYKGHAGTVNVPGL